MGPFQKYAIYLTIFILIIWTLILIWIYKNQTLGANWPPIIGKCPDYWTDESETNDGSKCVNRLKYGNPKCPYEANFNQGILSSPTYGKCRKKMVAQQCDWAWGGITYGTSQDPCLNIL